MAKKQKQSGIRKAGCCIVPTHDSRFYVHSQRDLGIALGVHSQTVQNWISEGLPSWPVGGRRRLYCIACSVQWLRSRRQARVPDDAELEAGPVTPSLERLRLARAKTAEFDLARKKQELMSMEMFERIIPAAIEPLARFGDRMIARYGLEFAESWKDAVAQFDAAIQEVCTTPDESED